MTRVEDKVEIYYVQICFDLNNSVKHTEPTEITLDSRIFPLLDLKTQLCSLYT